MKSLQTLVYFPIWYLFITVYDTLVHRHMTALARVCVCVLRGVGVYDFIDVWHRTYVCVFTCIFLCMQCMCVRVHMWFDMTIYVLAYMVSCLYICIFMCIYFYICWCGYILSARARVNTNADVCPLEWYNLRYRRIKIKSRRNSVR